MTPEIPSLFIPRARIIEVNPPRVEQTSSFKRVEPIIDAKFIPYRPRINYFQLRAASEYRKTAAWFYRPIEPTVIVFNRPINQPEAFLQSVKKIVQRLGLDRVLAWLKNNFWPQKAYQTIIASVL